VVVWTGDAPRRRAGEAGIGPGPVAGAAGRGRWRFGEEDVICGRSWWLRGLPTTTASGEISAPLGRLAMTVPPLTISTLCPGLSPVEASRRR
jgi:hypothetical protein